MPDLSVLRRTWRAEGKNVNRQVKFSDICNIGKGPERRLGHHLSPRDHYALETIRKGTAHIIKNYRPMVVPVVIDGFRRSFDKKGLVIKKKGILQNMVIKEPLDIRL